MFLKNKKNKKTVLLVGLAIFAIVFLKASHVLAQAETLAMEGDLPDLTNAFKGLTGVGSVTGRVIVAGVSKLLYGIFYFVSLFLGLAIWLLGVMTSHEVYENILFSPVAINAINIGWQLVRDFFNLFFILILIFVAISTILGVDKFSDKKIVLRVILAALLVNFSKPITVFVFDISNLAMNFFINNLSSAKVNMAEALAHKSKFANLMGMNIQSSIGYIAGILIAIIFVFVLALILFILAAALVYRMVAIWVLIILSPIAFFSLALPGGALSSANRDWWGKVTKWAFFGPVLLFFLWLALIIIGTVNEAIVINGSSLNFEIVGSGDGSGAIATSVISVVLRIIIPYLVAIYFLSYGYDLSRKMAQGAGKSVGGVMEKGEGFIRKWGKRAAFTTGVAATGGVGYYGGKAAKNLATDYISAKKEKWAEGEGIFGPVGKRFSKETRDKNREERKVKWAGKEEGAYRSKALEQLKKYETEGVDSGSIMEVIQGKDIPKARAMALYAAKNGQLDSIEKYEAALGVVKGDQVLQERFLSDVKKKNIYSVIQSEIAKRKVENPDLTQEEIQNIFNENLRNMKISDLNNQDVNLHQSPEFKAFVERNWKDKRQLRDIAARNLGAEKFRIWTEKGFFDQGPTS